MGSNDKISVRRIGYVYILEDDVREMVKIGKSRDPNQRLTTVRSSAGVSGGRAYATHRVSDCGKLESELHAIFSEQRENGEWFRVSFETAINALKKVLPAELSEAEYAKIAAENKIKGDADTEALAIALNLPSHGCRAKEMNGPVESISLTTKHLAMVSSYLQNQAKLYASLECELPIFSKISDNFLISLQYIDNAQKTLEEISNDLSSSLDGMDACGLKKMQEILTKQLP